MKLINLAHSPYAARVRILAYAKGLELELVPPAGLSTPEFKQFNILGKVPVLDTGEYLHGFVHHQFITTLLAQFPANFQLQ